MKKLQYIIGLLVLLSGIWSGCSQVGEVGKQIQGIPTAFGKINQLNVVGDKSLLEGIAGDTFHYYFTAPYLLLPQPEPIYDLTYFTPEELNEDHLRKEMKLYILLADLKDEESLTTKLVKKDIGFEKIRKIKEGKGYGSTVGRNKWAHGQILVYIFGVGEENLIESIQNNFPLIVKKLNDEQLPRIDATAYQGGENKTLGNEIFGSMGVNLKVPKEYFKAINDEGANTFWIRRETRKYSSNILLHKLKYTDQSQLSKEGLKSIRDSLGKIYVSTSTDGTYMRTNDVDLPMFLEQKNINNYYALEARGIWDIVNDYMGGPFISYLIHNPNTDELLFIDGFIHAPGEYKRNFMQEMEHVLNSVKF